jgi:flagellin
LLVRSLQALFGRSSRGLYRRFSSAQIQKELKLTKKTPLLQLGSTFHHNSRRSSAVVSLGSNISALRIQRRLSEMGDRIGALFEKLSSGSRLNQASDDPASLMMADSLRAQQRLARMAIRNANDGISALSIADSALGSIGGILTRMAELAAQASNGSYSLPQRQALQSEFAQLGSEVQRIALTTSFNGIRLLDYQGTFSVQVGINGSVGSQIGLPAVDATLFGLGLGNGDGLAFSLIGSTIAEAQESSRHALDALRNSVDAAAEKRGLLGATESRLGFAVSNLASYEQTLAEAESRLTDIDVAAEAAELVRLLILQQIGAAVLSFALREPQIALVLLR